MKPPTPAEAHALLSALTRALCAVGLLALTFTAVNVTLFARSRGVPLAIAVLLDPILSLALTAVLYADARLASWGIRPPRWSTALRWTAGCTAALMNCWASLWPDGQIGWPHHADPAAVALHLTPPLLLILLTETIAAYRRVVTELPQQRDTTGASRPGAPDPAPEHRSDDPLPDPDHTDRVLRHRWGHAIEPHRPGRAPGPPPPAAGAPEPGDDAIDDDLWRRAVALDATTRATTERPVSIWRLRTELHVGPDRARQIRDRLLTGHPDRPP